ncbi:hypothetical protein [Campylobacter hyointestinalis]|uniref:Uncharacterized protein n=1 Tax=Campylobacter hyointestinalis subsp. hyointestinalis TaxID=91352 RepID=A0A855N796_CAMHY|nr:hypothetical protein [Campylobacter hyointestinalis]MDL2346169.1 hypothetical protein [Campylobacter hyointestinalis]MDL2347909.1 hypothetical protein [Campylobacter hyointestinalis]MDL2349652.1 hypothetical protein [Campylobacter hyointestinalis]MDM1025673.1 hypothetical protein [Campylobacter hyointestinalis]MDM1027658.1 hypothetical protein [Campylobacter hyointestinalis]
MNAVNINMTLEASNFEKLQSFIFEIDPSAEIKVSNLEFNINKDDIENLKEVVNRVQNGTEKFYSSDEFKAMTKQKLAELGAL